MLTSLKSCKVVLVVRGAPSVIFAASFEFIDQFVSSWGPLCLVSTIIRLIANTLLWALARSQYVFHMVDGCQC